jgi:hypothetical protein
VAGRPDALRPSPVGLSVAIELGDLATHASDTDDARWQESFYLGWYDAFTGVGGAHHFSRKPAGGVAHVWSWVSVRGVVVGRAQDHALRCPPAGLTDVDLGALHVATRSPSDISLTARTPAASVELEYVAFCDPVEFSMDGSGVALGGRHYETTGRVTGRVTVGEDEYTIDGGAWQDHSWGLRQLASIPSSRFFFAVFDDTLAMSAHLLVSTTGSTTTFGWTYDRGVVRTVRHYAVPAQIADDGISPISCDIRLHADRGGGYRLQGTVDGCVLMGGADWTAGDWFGMDGLTTFECGGRLGEGIFEVCELKALSPAQRASLALT